MLLQVTNVKYCKLKNEICYYAKAFPVSAIAASSCHHIAETGCDQRIVLPLADAFD